MQVKRSQAIDLFAAVGFTSADEWKPQEMAAKLNGLAEIITDETDLSATPEMDELANEILEALNGGATITVENDLKGTAKPAAAKTTKKPAAKTTKKPAAKKTKAAKKKPAAKTTKKPAAKKKTTKKAAKPTKGAKKKPAKKAATPKPTANLPDGPDGVRETTATQPFLCGLVIKEFKLETGVTQAMVDRLAELNIEYGLREPATKSKHTGKNEHQDWFNLRNAWHAIRAYQGWKSNRQKAREKHEAKMQADSSK